MRLNFAAGILAGIAVAALLVVGSSYYQAGSAVGPGLLTPFGAQSASTASTITLSSTSQVVAATSTSTSSTTSSLTQGGALVATPKSNATSTSVAGNLSTNVNALQSSVLFGFASASQPPSSLAAMVYQPGRIPLLLIPILAALGLGFVLYRTFVQKE